MKKLASLLAVSVLAACGPSEQGAAPSAAVAPAPAAPPVAAAPAGPAPYSEFNTTATIRDVMDTLIDPTADTLWNAVRFENTEDGAKEYRPETDEDWAALRRAAVAIIEGGNSLMIPGRHVAAPGATTEFPQYEYMPDEVQAKLDENRAAFDGFAQGLQAAAVEILGAIDARNVELLSEKGGALDEACESCHIQYWYRPEVPKQTP
jgi:hypothetical protein